MNFDFNASITSAIKRCDGELVNDGNNNFDVYKIYPFTTENISGYIDNFSLKDKSLLTLGSSGDQVINAILYGCRDVTLLDKNPYCKYYYYLKIASMLCLDLDTFMKFLRFKNYSESFKDNKDIFKREIFEAIKSTLRLLDYESYLFWDELFQTFDPVNIRNRLFSIDENKTNVIMGCNGYLQNDVSYNKTKELVRKVTPNFICGDLFKIELDKKYDNIWLSNLGTYLSRHYVKAMTDKMSQLLNKNAQLLISYLYRTTKDIKYEEDWSPIYDLQKTFKILSEYKPELISFIGVYGFKFEDNDFKDSILVYRKH